MFKKGEKDSKIGSNIEEVHEGSPGQAAQDPPSPTFGKPSDWNDIKNTGVTGKSHH